MDKHWFRALEHMDGMKTFEDFADEFVSTVFQDETRVLVWGLTARIEDCDFADDIRLTTHRRR